MDCLDMDRHSPPHPKEGNQSKVCMYMATYSTSDGGEGNKGWCDLLLAMDCLVRSVLLVFLLHHHQVLRPGLLSLALGHHHTSSSKSSYMCLSSLPATVVIYGIPPLPLACLRQTDRQTRHPHPPSRGGRRPSFPWPCWRLTRVHPRAWTGTVTGGVMHLPTLP